VTDLASFFTPDFVWGAATAAYQIEGAVEAGGRGESIWDRFCATPGKVRAGDTGAIACDFYHRYRDDIALMKELGIDALRFSISWPRVLPEGHGRVSADGLDFYDRLIDALLEAGIAPYPTLYHWDLPQALEDAGGWPVRATADAFAGYAEAVAGRLGDRVGAWITHNEPWCASWLGYGRGIHAPGRASARDALAAAHHLLLSHGFAVEVLRRESPRSRVGITLDLYPMHPASGSDADREAARSEDGSRNRWFLDPVFRGSYPADTLERFAADLPVVADGDMATIAAPIDFLGVNHYTRTVVRAGPAGEPEAVHVPGTEHTDMGWEVYPPGIRETLARVAGDYGPRAIYVTENGAAYTDVRRHDGAIADVERCSYLDGYIRAVGEAVRDGVPVRGYFVWSLLDNFEWAVGYQRRFGVVYVDYPTLERIPKQSFGWYRDLIARSHGARAAA
jgi:beta-glucosidase